MSSQQHKGVLATTNQNFPWIAAVLCLQKEQSLCLSCLLVSVATGVSG